MKFNTVKNIRLRSSFSKKEFFFIVDKFLKINLFNTCFFKKNLNLLSNLNFKKKMSRVTLKNKCVLTGCSKSVNKDYNISRVQFRKLLQFGIISNYKKSVW